MKDIKKSFCQVQLGRKQMSRYRSSNLGVSSFTNRARDPPVEFNPDPRRNACSYRAWERVGRDTRGRIHGLVVSPTSTVFLFRRGSSREPAKLHARKNDREHLSRSRIYTPDLRTLSYKTLL